MLEIFEQMTPAWFSRATFYTGSVGPLYHDFRFRYEQDKSDKDHPILHAAVYSRTCYELAEDVERQDFSWDDDGVEALKQWLQARYEHFLSGQPLGQA